jgi:hypothetical protein
MYAVALYLESYMNVPWQNIVWPFGSCREETDQMIDRFPHGNYEDLDPDNGEAPTLVVKDTEHTRALCIAGMQAIIEGEIAKNTYSVLVLDMDGLPAGPYTLTSEDLEIDAHKEHFPEEEELPF